MNEPDKTMSLIIGNFFLKIRPGALNVLVYLRCIRKNFFLKTTRFTVHSSFVVNKFFLQRKEKCGNIDVLQVFSAKIKISYSKTDFSLSGIFHR